MGFGEYWGRKGKERKGKERNFHLSAILPHEHTLSVYTSIQLGHVKYHDYYEGGMEVLAIL